MNLPKTVDVVAYFKPEGEIRPYRFRVTKDDGEYEVIKIKRILQQDYYDVKKNTYIIFKCEVILNQCRRCLDLKFEKPSCKWYLNKIR